MKKAFKKVGRFRFSLESALRIWQFQFIASLILLVPSTILNQIIEWVANSSGSAITTANLSSLLSWRLPVIIPMGLLIMFLYFTFEILAQVYLCEDILNADPTHVLIYLKKGVKALKHFLNPKGFLILLFVFIGVPICGVGFSISLTKNFYIPNFITSVIWSNLLYSILYIAVILFLVYICWESVFVFHFVLLDDMDVGEGLKHSKELMKEHKFDFLWRLIKFFFLMALFLALAYILFQGIPIAVLTAAGEKLPIRYVIDLNNPSALDNQVLTYRILSCLAVITGRYLIFIIETMIAGNFMMFITKMYNLYTNKTDRGYYIPYSRYRTLGFILRFTGVLGFFMGISFAVGYAFDTVYIQREDVKITAHRTGGNLASENSLEGIDAAVEHNCYGSETDIQRTLDGHYIINHDNTFKRLTGDPHKPVQLTLEQIKQLRITDTTGSGALLEVPTMEELLDRGKGRITLFLELKGETADKKMADDIIAAVKERDMVDDVVLISLNYNVIDYVETNYPEFETGILIFSALGDVSRMNCDMIIMEEEMSTTIVINTIHDAGKKVGVWTVDTDYSLRHFLDSRADIIITDEVKRAIEIQKELNERTDIEIIEDFSDNIFS